MDLPAHAGRSVPLAVKKSAEELLALLDIPIAVKLASSVTATYYKRRRPGLFREIREYIQFGGKMIELHLSDRFWDLVLKDLHRFGLLRKNSSAPAITLAALVIHEVSHALVVRSHTRRVKSHGREFKNMFIALAEKHLERIAVRITELSGDHKLMTPRPGLESFIKARNDRCVTPQQKELLKGLFVAGDPVSFRMRNGTPIRGICERFGRKRWIIRVEIPLLFGKKGISRYRVPAALLTKGE